MTTANQGFAGDKKVGHSILSGPETRLKNWAVPRIPGAVETYHLTLLTLVWSLLNAVLAFFAKDNLQVLWLVSLMIVMQYLTDLFDGELGRQRDTGLVKWGFYMDHFLDYIFLCSLVFILINVFIIFFGTRWFFILLPTVVLICLAGLIVNTFQIQKKLWQIDMEAKGSRKK